MARSRVTPFLRMVEIAVHEHSSVRDVIEAMRVFGYINEHQYSELNTGYTQMTHAPSVRSDGAETIELARDPVDTIPGMIPREY